MMRPASIRASRGGSPILDQIKEGIRHARQEPVIKPLLILTATGSVFVFQYATIMPSFAKSVFNVGAEGLGVLMSGAGVGALISAVSVASLGHRFRRGTLMVTGSILLPVGLIAFSQCPGYHLSVVCLALVGLGQMLFLAVSNSVIQTQTPDHLRGRILALRTFVFLGLAPLGAFQVGTLAEYIGVREAILLGGVTTLAVSLYFAVRHKAVRSAA
jgi:MFS family permease